MASRALAEYATETYKNSPDRDILTPEGCRNLLQIGEKALPQLIGKGLPAVPVGNSYRFVRSRVIEWMAGDGEKLLSLKQGS